MSDNPYMDLPDENPYMDLPDEAPPRSRSEAVMRQLGLTARHTIEGGLAIPATLANIPAVIMNVGLSGADKVAQRFGGSVDYRFPEQNQAISQYLTAKGLPEPEGTGERIVGAISRGLAGGGSLPLAFSRLTGPVAGTLASNPALQTVSGGTAGGTGQTAAEMGAGPVGQFVAGMAGGVSPSVLAAGGPAVVRGAFRGSDPSTVRQNIDDFSKAGTTPSVGQATQGRVAQATESGLARTPGAAGRMTAAAEKQADEIAQSLDAKANQLAGKTSASRAGKAIEKGIRGEGGFIDRFHTTQTRLYDELDNYVPLDSPVAVSNAQRTLSEMTKVIKGAEKTSGGMVNPALSKIADDLAVDAAQGTIPFEALKSLRSRVGEKLSTVSITDDIPRAQWKRLYGALSDDLKAAAQASGNPKAMQAWNRANTYTKAGHNRIDTIESVLKRKGGPEKIFAAATSGTKEGATVLRSVMQSLDTEGQKIVTATVLRRLGLAKAGVQNELGDRFSTETFLSNWNLLSKEAKRTLFDRYGPGFRSDMDAVARMAANLREGSQVFRNPSGTAQAAAQYTTAGAFAMAVFTGNIGPAAAIAGGVAGSNRMAALMTNPRFVKWLAQTSKVPAGAIPAQINVLAQQARESGDTDLGWAVALLEEGYREQNQQTEGGE